MAVTTIPDLLNRSNTIKNEITEGANDENRIGTLFRDAVETLSNLSDGKATQADLQAETQLREYIDNLLENEINMLEAALNYRITDLGTTTNPSIDDKAAGLFRYYAVGGDEIGNTLLFATTNSATGVSVQYRWTPSGAMRRIRPQGGDWSLWDNEFSTLQMQIDSLQTSSIIELGPNPNIDDLSDGIIFKSSAGLNTFILMQLRGSSGSLLRQFKFSFDGILSRTKSYGNWSEWESN